MMGQEQTDALLFNFQKAEQAKMEKYYPSRAARGGGSLVLPFFDDFSRYSLPTSNPDVLPDWQRWQDDHAYINNHLPIDQPTVGVATLDGLDRTGYPYDFFTNGSEHEPADSLTSLPIDLSGLGQADGVHLMFFYQPEGNGNSPDIEDSLIVEFKVGPGVWKQKWGVAGSSLMDFQQVFIEVWDPDFGNFYFVDDFQFRFRNKSEGSGNLDHWHIDYVLLDNDLDPETFQIQDLAIVDVPTTLLNSSLTSMPWTHFLTNPSGFMISENVILKERNLNSIDYNFTSGYRVDYEDQSWDMLNGFSNTSGNANSAIDTDISVNNNPNNFVFDETVNDTCAIFSVNYYHQTLDANVQNDSASVDQEFFNYYAYDDGSAEKAWFINAAGGKVAVKHQAVIPDTLLGLLIHFTPFRDDNSDELFILRAWSDDGGQPGEELMENFGSHTPEYYSEGYNLFKYYSYDDPIPIDGSFFCGFVQSEAVKMNVGLDVNTNTNSFKTQFTLGPFEPWQSSGVDGSLMIRPVFTSGKSPDNVSVGEIQKEDWSIYPNPVQDILIVDTPFSRSNILIYDISGRVVFQESASRTLSQLDVSNLPNGTYIVEIQNLDSTLPLRKKFIKN